VRNGEVLIVDEFTGRVMSGRRFGKGLHQAIEAKEHVEVQPENQTVSSISYQNLFRMYPVLSGMTGTAMTEAAEFEEISDNIPPPPTNIPLPPPANIPPPPADIPLPPPVNIPPPPTISAVPPPPANIPPPPPLSAVPPPPTNIPPPPLGIPVAPVGVPPAPKIKVGQSKPAPSSGGFMRGFGGLSLSEQLTSKLGQMKHVTEEEINQQKANPIEDENDITGMLKSSMMKRRMDIE